MDNERLEVLKQIVLAAGGEWVGLQEGIGRPPLVLFNSPTTYSTLALPDDENFTVSAVDDHIRKSDKKFEQTPARVPRSVLRRTIVELENATSSLKIYLEGK